MKNKIQSYLFLSEIFPEHTFSVAKATLEIALSVCQLVSNPLSSNNFNHQLTLFIKQLQSTINFNHQSTLIIIHLFDFSSPLSGLIRLFVLFLFRMKPSFAQPTVGYLCHEAIMPSKYNQLLPGGTKIEKFTITIF